MSEYHLNTPFLHAQDQQPEGIQILIYIIMGYTYSHSYMSIEILYYTSITYIQECRFLINKNAIFLTHILNFCCSLICAMSLIFCTHAAARLLQDYFHHHANIWPIRMMDHEQNDCFGMTGSLWVPYQHDHILKGRLFGRVDIREFAWCDCFFGCCMFYG